MAELGRSTMSVRSALAKISSDPNAWVEAYTAKDGWHCMDQAQRRLETWVANLEDEPDERPLGVVRRACEDVCHDMAECFTKAFIKAVGRRRDRYIRRTSTARSSRTGRGRSPISLSMLCALRWGLSSPSAYQKMQRSASDMPVRSLRCHFRVCENRRHSGLSRIHRSRSLHQSLARGVHRTDRPHAHDAAVVEHQPVTVPQRGRLRQIEQESGATLSAAGRRHQARHDRRLQPRSTGPQL
jgi:hypothetical protein